MYEIKKVTKNAEIVEILLNFPQESQYFKGHFPTLSVLPGFVQIGLAINLAKEYFEINPEITHIKRMKFTKIISPEKNINLKLEYDVAAKNLTFQYNDSNGENYSSGKFYFK